jgi:hypothetical protein
MSGWHDEPLLCIATDSVSNLAASIFRKTVGNHLSADLACLPLDATLKYHPPATEVVIKAARQTRAQEVKLKPIRRQWLRCARLSKLP